MDSRLTFRPHWSMLFPLVRRLIGLPSVGRGVRCVKRHHTRSKTEVIGLNGPEKPAGSGSVSVSQTDTGRRGEYPQARERTHVKELGNLSLYLRKKGSPISVYGLAPEA